MLRIAQPKPATESDKRKAQLISLLENEAHLQELLSKERGNKISIYADMLFSTDQLDFIDFMTSTAALSFGMFSALIACMPPDSDIFQDFCRDPAAMTQDALMSLGIAVAFGSLHMLYRYFSSDGYDLDRANWNIERLTKDKAAAARKREALFPESKSYFSSAIDTTRKFLGM